MIRLLTALFACFLLLTVSCLLPAESASAAKSKGGKSRDDSSTGTQESPLALDEETYFFRVPDANSCIGEDDELDWRASGFLAPGQRFTFTPRMGSCNAHPAAITVVAEWDAGVLELSSTVPDADYSSWDAEQFGRAVSAPVYGGRAYLCMFPEFSSEGIRYTVNLANRSDSTVTGIRVHGRHENDWSIFYYPRCMNADADGDGWNDSLEHTMANMVYPNGYIDGVYQPDILWGSNYLRAHSTTTNPNDEVDSYPPDFNDDGAVNQLDIELLELQLGLGNGIPLQSISPNSGPAAYRQNTLPWRRYDLDGDGFVDSEDRRIVLDAFIPSVPPSFDVIHPSAKVLEPAPGQTVGRGTNVHIQAHAWDNAGIASVEYLVDGKTICRNSDPVPKAGTASPIYYCWWSVPRKNMTHTIEVVVTDTSGNATVSDVLEVGTH